MEQCLHGTGGSNHDSRGIKTHFEYIRIALEQDVRGAEVWTNLTPGKQRSFAYNIERGKHPQTRIRRALTLLERIKEEQ